MWLGRPMTWQWHIGRSFCKQRRLKLLEHWWSLSLLSTGGSTLWSGHSSWPLKKMPTSAKCTPLKARQWSSNCSSPRTWEIPGWWRTFTNMEETCAEPASPIPCPMWASWPIFWSVVSLKGGRFLWWQPRKPSRQLVLPGNQRVRRLWCTGWGPMARTFLLNFKGWWPPTRRHMSNGHLQALDPCFRAVHPPTGSSATSLRHLLRMSMSTLLGFLA